jgi:hypothetical protein
MAKITVWIWLFFPVTCIAQKRISIEALAGANQSFVRNKVLTGDGPSYGLHFGISARYFFQKNNKLSLGMSLLHSQKGYRQKDFVQYDPTFFYGGWQTLVFYKFHSSIAAYGGLEVSWLNDVNVTEGLSTYQHNDLGLVTGLRFFDSKGVSINTQMVCGFKPVLHYHEFDKYGNIAGSIKDLKNLCISIGIAYKV